MLTLRACVFPDLREEPLLLVRERAEALEYQLSFHTASFVLHFLKLRDLELLRKVGVQRSLLEAFIGGGSLL